MKRVLCYGDSNTWGYVPGLGVRHPEDVRWTGVAAKLLGPDYRIIEEGMNGFDQRDLPERHKDTGRIADPSAPGGGQAGAGV